MTTRRITVPLVIALAGLLLPLPYYLLIHRPAVLLKESSTAELKVHIEMRDQARKMEKDLATEREKAVREGRDADAKRLQDRQTEENRLAEEAQARMKGWDNARHEAAFTRAVTGLFVLIGTLGFVVGLSVGLISLFGGGIRVGLLCGSVVGVVMGGIVGDVWFAILISNPWTPLFFAIPLITGGIGLLIGIIFGWITRSRGV